MTLPKHRSGLADTAQGILFLTGHTPERKECLMKKILSAALVLTLMLGALPAANAAQPDVSGPPVFDVTTTVVPTTLAVYQNEAVAFVATTTYTSNKNENQLLHFVSDAWLGAQANDSDAGAATAVTIEAEPAAAPNQRSDVFTSRATVVVSDEPGDYDVVVKYTITLQHDHSGQRTYQTLSSSSTVTITVMPGTADNPVEEPSVQGQALNHGQIVSAWAHWKQTKGNKNFAAGGPGVYRSLVWYKTQVENKTFYSQQEVKDYLESIYEPAPKNNVKNNNGNNGNNGNNSKDNKGNNRNGKGK